MHPILFKVGPLTIGSYGVCVLLAAGVGWLLIPRYARRAGIDPEAGRQVFLGIFVGGFLGCRLLNIVLRLPEVIEDPRLGLWFLQQAGVWYGAIAGGLLAAWWLVRKHGLRFSAVMDMNAVPAVVGGGIGRLGCLMSGCCYGTPTDLPWAITYTNPVAHRLHADLPWVPLHPVPLYELAATLVIAAILDVAGRGRLPRGSIALLWIALYGAARSGIEIFRGDLIRGELLGELSTSQTIGLASAAVATAVLVYRWRTAPAVHPGRGPDGHVRTA